MIFREEIESLSAYHVADSEGLIKLDAMENPYQLDDDFRDRYLQTLGDVALNRYPDAGHLALRKLLAEREGLQADQVLFGNGSDDLLQMILLAVRDGSCVVPSPSFVMYGLISRWLQRPCVQVPLRADFQLDVAAMIEACQQQQAAVVFLACPNNPTANLWPMEDILAIANGFDGLLVIDEAYLPFASRTHVALIHERVLVLRTFSKMGMAGLRLGYALGHEQTIATLNKVRMPYNINALTQKTAMFFLQNMDVFETQVKAILSQRAVLQQQLSAFAELELFPSESNFFLLRVADAEDCFAFLLKHRILIKNMSQAHPLLDNCLRITVGTPNENRLLIEALKEYFS